MSDYIDREAAIKAIQNDVPICQFMKRSVSSAVHAMGTVCATLDAIPAADVVEVVRCGECMFWDAPPSCEGLARCRTGESGVRFRKAYDFCSRAQKDGRRC